MELERSSRHLFASGHLLKQGVLTLKFVKLEQLCGPLEVLHALRHECGCARAQQRRRRRREELQGSNVALFKCFRS